MGLYQFMPTGIQTEGTKKETPPLYATRGEVPAPSSLFASAVGPWR
jgi:hypothetical protein